MSTSKIVGLGARLGFGLFLCLAGAKAAEADNRFQFLNFDVPKPVTTVLDAVEAVDPSALLSFGRIDLRPVERGRVYANTGVVADYYPLGGGLRLSGGAFGAIDDLPAIAPGSGAADDIATRATQDITVSPLVTLGYRHDFGSGWSVSGDLGAILDGASESDLSATSSADSNDSVSPFLRLGIGFRF